MPFWKWSKTADNNQTADPTINWQEGQLPSTVNNSARAMMARTAEWRDDISGSLATSGTDTAFSVASNQVVDSLVNMDKAMICFVPHVTNASSPTLNVDGLGAKPICWAPNQPVQSAVLVAGTPYAATYSNVAGQWILQGAGNGIYGVPLGAGMDYWGSVAPSSAFAFPYGQAVSRTVYSNLYSIFGTTYGPGDGSTTFNLPDKRGLISAALDNLGGGASAGRLSAIAGTSLGTISGSQTGVLSQANLPAVNLTGAGVSLSASGVSGGDNNDHSHSFSGTTSGQSVDHTHQMTSGYAFNAVNSGGGFTALSNVTGSQNLGTTGGVSQNHTHSISGVTGGVNGTHTHNVTVAGTTSALSVALGGSGQPYGKLPPLIICSYIIRII